MSRFHHTARGKAKARSDKYKDAQQLLSRATNRTQELFFQSEETELPLLDKAVSKLQEAQSLILKARMRMKSDD